MSRNRYSLIQAIKTNQRYLKLLLFSILVGVIVGFAAVIIKGGVRVVSENLTRIEPENLSFLYDIVLPLFGISLTVLFVRYLIKGNIGAGISSVLYAISKTQGKIRVHHVFSSVLSSILTVGFGGSAGLEGPTITTGGAIGSNIARIAKLEYKEVLLLIGCASAGAISAIFKAPIAGVIFAIEVMLLDLTFTAVGPLILASISAVTISFIFQGQDSLYTIKQFERMYQVENLELYLLLGLSSGIFSSVFNSVYIWINNKFQLIKKKFLKVFIGALIIGTGIFMFPSLFGAGDIHINDILNGNIEVLFENSIVHNLSGIDYRFFIVMLALVLIKVVLTSTTLAAGGVGGVFSPILFVGATQGFTLASLLHLLGFNIDKASFALVGMGGMIAGVIHAPLTAIFLIAEITSGYYLIIPLMIVSIVSFGIVKLFREESIYTFQLLQQGLVITHNKDKATINKLRVGGIIEDDFVRLTPECTIDELMEKLQTTKRNVFPVLDENRVMVGIITLNDVRKYVFDRKTDHSDLTVGDLMYFPETWVDYDDTIENIVEKLATSGHYNVPVLKNGKYIGFISRVKLFETYRNRIKETSDS